MDLMHLLPRWTKRSIIEDTGRDPLGLSRVAHLLSDFLVPGIITTTFRARYYSFFCWALDHTCTEDQWKNSSMFWDGLRRREAALILATLFHRERENGEELHVDGIVQGKKYLDYGKKEGLFNCDFSPLSSNHLGAYGQYYSGAMRRLGLVEIGEKGIDQIVQTNNRAINLAREYGANIAKTPWIKKKLYKEDKISASDLEKSAEALSLDSLNKPWAKKEREELIKVFFGHDDKDNTTLQLRKTLLLILNIIDTYDNIGSKLNKDELFDSGFVAPIYYRELRLADKTTAPYSPLTNLKSCIEYWELFICHHFLTFALESLLEGILEIAGNSIIGVAIPELIDSLVGRDFNERLKNETDIKAITPPGYLSWLGTERIPPSKTESQEFARKGTLLSRYSEAEVTKYKCRTPGELTWKALAIIFRLYARWRGRRDESTFVELAKSAQNELWLGNIIETLDKLFAQNSTWRDLVENIIIPWILDQHDLVMYSKKRLDACWLHIEGGKVFKDQDYWPRQRNPRWKNAISIMQDLGLIDIDPERFLTLSTRGKSILRSL